MLAKRWASAIILWVSFLIAIISSSYVIFPLATMPSARSAVPSLSLPPPPIYQPSLDARATQTASSMRLQQNEPSIAINPKKPTNMIVAYNNYDDTIERANDSITQGGGWPQVHWSYSIDGGTTWTAGAVTLSQAGLSSKLWSDTAVGFDGDGNAYLVSMTLYDVALYVSIPDGNGNAGITWNGPYVVAQSDELVDKPAIVVDTTGGSHNGNIYIAWNQNVRLSGRVNQLIYVRTATLIAGVPNFSGPPVEASGINEFNWGAAITVSPSGSLYVAFVVFDNHFRYGSPRAIAISRSDNGGVSFAMSGQIVDSSVIRPVSSNSGISATSLPTIVATNAGTVLVAWTDGGAGNMDIQSRTSSTGGVSWTPRVRVNDKTLRDQFLPAAATDGQLIYVFYYSTHVNNVNGGVYYVTSLNNGASFSGSSPFSSFLSHPSVCTFGPQPCLWGDYMGAVGVSKTVNFQTTTTICSAWADSRDHSTLHDNDVNIYSRCIKNSFFDPPISWTWYILRPPVHALAPLGPPPLPGWCTFYPNGYGCPRIWLAAVLSLDDAAGTQPVNLTAISLPAGIGVDISPSSGVPPYEAVVTLQFDSATCGDAACLESVTVSATDGTNTTTIEMYEILLNTPGLVTDTNLYNPDETTNLTGIGFTANSTVTVMLDGSDAGGSSTDPGGSFNLLVSLPTTLTPGIHTLQATDSEGKTASTIFQSPKVSPEPGPSQPLTALTPVVILISAVVIGTTIILTRRQRRNTSMGESNGFDSSMTTGVIGLSFTGYEE